MYLKSRHFLVGRNGILPVAALFLLGALLLALPQLALAADVQRVEGLDVDEVVVHGSVEVEITQSDGTELLIRGRPSDLQPAPFHIRGRTLLLGLPEGGRSSKLKDLQFKLTLPTLARLQLRGSGDVFVRSLSTPALTLTGSGDIHLGPVTAEEIAAVVNGSGDISSGKGSTSAAVEISIVGSGEVNFSALDGDQAEINIVCSGRLQRK